MAISLASCTSDSLNEPINSDDLDDSKVATRFEPIQFTAEEREAIDAAKPFGLDLFRTYSELSAADNIVISPLSAIIDLGMLANGATDETQAEILEALGWSAQGLEDMNSYARRLMSEYQDMDHTTDVMISNGIFRRKGYQELKADYTEKMKYIYDADSKYFGDDTWEMEISNWISDKTNGLIKDMDLNYKGAHTSLINALYFRGIWKEPFDKEKTISDKFTNSDGTVSEVKYMCERRSMSVYQNEMFAGVGLDFGNGAYTIEFIKPNDELDVDAGIEDLDMEMWSSLHSSWKVLDINLRIPKFEMSVISDFKESLIALGINRAFGLAQLGNMFVNPEADVTVNSVMQGCTFSLDEEGVTASGTTSANIGDTSSGPLEDGGDFFLDHPFMFAIRENSSGAILFIGKIGKL